MKFFGREPALILSLIATAIRLFSAFFINLTTEQQAWLNALATAGMGLLIALVVHQGIPAAILGFIQAILALGVGLGLHISAETQAVIMSFVGSLVAMFIRTQVVAPVPPEPARTA